jgi:hypothetical protein
MSRARQGEGKLSDAIRDALATEPGLRVMRNSVGVVKSRGRFYHTGLGNGSADLICVLAPAGRLVALEVKTDDGEATPEQEGWLADMRALGAFAAVVRSPLQALAAIRRARNGEAS